MKARTIRAVLRKKMDDWLASIEDERVRDLAAKGTIITGGAIASMLLRETVNDFDLYFRNVEIVHAVMQYYLDRFVPKLRSGIPCAIYIANAEGHAIDRDAVVPAGSRLKTVIKSAGVASEEGNDKPYEYFEARPEGEAGAYISAMMDDPEEIADALDETEALAQQTTADEGKPRYRPVFVSSNAITLSDRIQIINRFYGEPDDIHANYDFVHCTNYWQSWDSQLVLRKDALEALLTRELRYIGSKYPICSLIRIRKFVGRGWTVNAGQILKAVMQIGELDLKSIAVLEDQLTGVDAAYFLEVMAKLKDKDPEKVNAAYLIEIVDRMF